MRRAGLAWIKGVYNCHHLMPTTLLQIQNLKKKRNCRSLSGKIGTFVLAISGIYFFLFLFLPNPIFLGSIIVKQNVSDCLKRAALVEFLYHIFSALIHWIILWKLQEYDCLNQLTKTPTKEKHY